MYTRLLLVLGDQLYPQHEDLTPHQNSVFFMAEDYGLCTHFRYHKHKLVLFLSAMRSHADDIKEKYPLEYYELNTQNKRWSYEEKLSKTLEKYTGITTLVRYEIEDVFFEKRIHDFCEKNNLKQEIIPSQGFITSRENFKKYLDNTKKPFMHSFYQQQRKELGILMTDDGKPLNGEWSFDKENRKKLPKDVTIPDQPQSEINEHDQQVIELVNQLFEEHPGNTNTFHFSTTRRSALHRLNTFLKERFEDFGPYEDAIHTDEVFAFHSVLSPYINMGLITPNEVIDAAVSYFHEHDTHFPSVEGFVRQIIGWREFMRGIYHNFDVQKNFFNHTRTMKKCWYTGETGITPLDDAIIKADTYAYTHHIERLMVLGNIMLMAEIHPDNVYAWFMEMYADSADWVMAPNVYAMSQFAEEGIFATKPYISGSNYIKKMSNYSNGDWCDIVDGLYWRFIQKNRETFKNNHRMGMMIATLERMNVEKKERIFSAAEEWIQRVTR